MSHSEAWSRFQKSRNIGYDQWHDGIGYDLESFSQMTPEEKESVAREFRIKTSLDWRDMEVLRLCGDGAAFDKLRDVLATGTIEERAHSLRNLLDMGKMSGSVPDVQLAHVLDDIDGLPGLTTALLIAEQYAGPMSNAALLRGARDRPGVSVHFAGMICFLAGISDEVFDWKLRPLFLRLSQDYSERMKAFAELCVLTGVDPSKIPDAGRGIGVVFPKAKAR